MEAQPTSAIFVSGHGSLSPFGASIDWGPALRRLYPHAGKICAWNSGKIPRMAYLAWDGII
ncbi:hypothetical protein N7504_000658 [Penicillium tannophilum]|nr:hypothetical protein N7504_000658 [Penicillium tannophilum]